MKLQQALKVSLDGLLMQMLGVQVLFGFQFQGLFQDNFETLPTSARMVDAAGLGMMVVALGLMIAVPCQHRIVEEGETTPRIYASSVWYAQRAFLPLAVAISCDLWVALTILFGETGRARRIGWRIRVCRDVVVRATSGPQEATRRQHGSGNATLRATAPLGAEAPVTSEDTL